MKKIIDLCRLLPSYVVDDLMPDSDVKILFILESPHTEELKEKVPLAGSTGIAVTEVLKCVLGLEDNSEAFGKIIKKQLNLKNIGIVNVSSVPLQNIYPEHMKCNELRVFELIREKPYIRKNKITKKGYDDLKKEDVNKIFKIIKNDFCCRINGYFNDGKITSDTLIILCGKVSEYFWKECNCNHQNTINVPHPSNEQWFKPKYINQVKNMKAEIRRFYF